LRVQKVAVNDSVRLVEVFILSRDGRLKPAYNKFRKALTGFIGDRLNLPEDGHSNQQYIQALKEQDLYHELVKNIRMLLLNCSSIIYAPSNSHEFLKSHVELAKSTLKMLKKVL